MEDGSELRRLKVHHPPGPPGEGLMVADAPHLGSRQSL